MSQELQYLIDRIQTEAVEEAEKKAASILQEATAEAARIVEAATAEAALKIQKADEEAQLFEARSRETLRQSGRNLLIHIGDRLSSVLNELIHNEVKEALTLESLQGILAQIVPAFLEANGQKQDLKLLVGENELQQLEQYFQKEFSKTLQNGLRIETDPSIEKGFMISGSADQAVHDFTSEAIADSMSIFLRPRLSEIIREASKLEAAG